MSEPQEEFVISIMSRDRIGIVYEISSAISSMGGNIADIRQSVLCGYFTMILLATFPASVTQRHIQRKLAEVDARSETSIDAVVEKAVPGAATSATPIPDNAYVLTATGSNQIGIVATVTAFCVKHQINILDLSTTTADGAYVMILIIDLGCCASIAEVRQDLQQLGRESGLKVVLQHHHIFRAVNEINLPIR